jgi:hypothetical protein
MTPTLSKPPRSHRPARRRSGRPSHAAPPPPRLTRPSQRSHDRARRLARYVDASGRAREVITRSGFAGSVLVVDRDADSLEDRRLVAHLGADEPRQNATIVCREYLERAKLCRAGCRAVRREDLSMDPLADEHMHEWSATQRARGHDLTDGTGAIHRLELVQTGMSIPELRWRRLAKGETEGRCVSTRDVIAALASYEPVRLLSHSALAIHRDDPEVSVTVLRAELRRVLESSIVLNRGLREAVLAAIEREQLSMSEIATRCGRVKRDRSGGETGETSWLARRVGLLPEGGHAAPTPWVHSDVLGLISRRGLGISPREVEL